MPIRKIFAKRPEDEEAEAESYVEVNVMDSSERKSGTLGIRIEKLTEFADTDRILKHIRKGSVVFLKIKDLREKDMGELKRAVEKLKKTVIANNGDIAGVESDWLIITPEYAAVERA
ncbi:MAG: cell division protein SepF [Candidatus Aenigmatarchaeota archaeon]